MRVPIATAWHPSIETLAGRHATRPRKQPRRVGARDWFRSIAPENPPPKMDTPVYKEKHRNTLFHSLNDNNDDQKQFT